MNRGHCFCLIIALSLFIGGIVMLLAGFMRTQIINKQYTQMDCYTTETEVCKIEGICVFRNCAPDKYEGRVLFELVDRRTIWAQVFTSYDNHTVQEYLLAYFPIGQKLECYVNNRDDNIVLKLHETAALLGFSILLILSGISFTVFASLCIVRHRRNSYIELDKVPSNLY